MMEFETAVKAFISSRNEETFREVLTVAFNLGQPTDYRFKDGNTLLHWAVQYNLEQETMRLLHSGASLHTRNKMGLSPMDIALENGNQILIQLLTRRDIYRRHLRHSIHVPERSPSFEETSVSHGTSVSPLLDADACSLASGYHVGCIYDDYVDWSDAEKCMRLQEMLQQLRAEEKSLQDELKKHTEVKKQANGSLHEVHNLLREREHSYCERIWNTYKDEQKCRVDLEAITVEKEDLEVELAAAKKRVIWQGSGVTRIYNGFVFQFWREANISLTGESITMVHREERRSLLLSSIARIELAAKLKTLLPSIQRTKDDSSLGTSPLAEHPSRVFISLHLKQQPSERHGEVVVISLVDPDQRTSSECDTARSSVSAISSATAPHPASPTHKAREFIAALRNCTDYITITGDDCLSSYITRDTDTNSGLTSIESLLSFHSSTRTSISSGGRVSEGSMMSSGVSRGVMSGHWDMKLEQIAESAGDRTTSTESSLQRPFIAAAALNRGERSSSSGTTVGRLSVEQRHSDWNSVHSIEDTEQQPEQEQQHEIDKEEEYVASPAFDNNDSRPRCVSAVAESIGSARSRCSSYESASCGIGRSRHSSNAPSINSLSMKSPDELQRKFTRSCSLEDAGDLITSVQYATSIDADEKHESDGDPFFATDDDTAVEPNALTSESPERVPGVVPQLPLHASPYSPMTKLVRTTPSFSYSPSTPATEAVPSPHYAHLLHHSATSLGASVAKTLNFDDAVSPQRSDVTKQPSWDDVALYEEKVTEEKSVSVFDGSDSGAKRPPMRGKALPIPLKPAVATPHGFDSLASISCSAPTTSFALQYDAAHSPRKESNSGEESPRKPASPRDTDNIPTVLSSSFQGERCGFFKHIFQRNKGSFSDIPTSVPQLVSSMSSSPRNARNSIASLPPRLPTGPLTAQHIIRGGAVHRQSFRGVKDIMRALTVVRSNRSVISTRLEKCITDREDLLEMLFYLQRLRAMVDDPPATPARSLSQMRLPSSVDAAYSVVSELRTRFRSAVSSASRMPSMDLRQESRDSVADRRMSTMSSSCNISAERWSEAEQYVLAALSPPVGFDSRTSESHSQMTASDVCESFNSNTSLADIIAVTPAPRDASQCSSSAMKSKRLSKLPADLPLGPPPPELMPDFDRARTCLEEIWECDLKIFETLEKLAHTILHQQQTWHRIRYFQDQAKVQSIITPQVDELYDIDL